MPKWLLMGLSALFLTLTSVPGTRAADLPKSTLKILAANKFDPSLLNGVDKELKVPQAWLDGAAKEKEVVIHGVWTPKQFREVTAPFRERYPFIHLNYARTNSAGRGVKVLIGLAEGSVLADVVTNFGDAAIEYAKTKALADLRDLPGFKNLPKTLVANDGTWVSFKLGVRCIGYNTTKVKEADLPKTWDDLLTNPFWRNGNLALSNHPDAWLLALWNAKGEKWGEHFTRTLFEVVKPQHRREGLTATTALTIAGEAAGNVPAPLWIAEKYRRRGAPIGYHCPSPVPVNGSPIAMLKKSPHKDGARIFINWLISKEGQLVQHALTYAVPVHKEFQSARFVPFAKYVLGKPQVIRTDDQLASDMDKKMQKLWRSYWAHGLVGKGRKKKRKH